MCRRVTCPDCAKPTFAGCGAHVEQVLGDVPKDKRCSCSQTVPAKRKATATPSWWPSGNKGIPEAAK